MCWTLYVKIIHGNNLRSTDESTKLQREFLFASAKLLEHFHLKLSLCLEIVIKSQALIFFWTGSCLSWMCSLLGEGSQFIEKRVFHWILYFRPSPLSNKVIKTKLLIYPDWELPSRQKHFYAHFPSVPTCLPEFSFSLHIWPFKKLSCFFDDLKKMVLLSILVISSKTIDSNIIAHHYTGNCFTSNPHSVTL